MYVDIPKPLSGLSAAVKAADKQENHKDLFLRDSSPLILVVSLFTSTCFT